MSFLTTLINGISLGSMYALIALGYTMVYGIAKMLNFAHGDVIMIGGITTLTVMQKITASFAISEVAGAIISLLVAIIICTVLGITVEKVAYKPLRQASSLAVLITAIGVSYFLQNTALLTFGSKKEMITFKFLDALSIKVNDELTIHGATLVNVVTMVVIMIALVLFINFTKSGTAMRAVSEDNGAAQLMGINVNGTISLTFAIGSALAGVLYILDELKTTQSFKSVALKTGLSQKKVVQIFDKYVDIPREPIPKILGIDEFHYKSTGDEKYACILINNTPENPTIVDIIKDRKIDTLSYYFQYIDRKERENVNFFVSDMYDGYKYVHDVWFPSSIHIIDTFHFIRLSSILIR